MDTLSLLGNSNTLGIMLKKELMSKNKLRKAIIFHLALVEDVKNEIIKEPDYQYSSKDKLAKLRKLALSNTLTSMTKRKHFKVLLHVPKLLRIMLLREQKANVRVVINQLH